MPSKVKQNRLALDLCPGLTHFDRDTTRASCRRESISLCRSKLSCPCVKCFFIFRNLLLNCTAHYGNLSRILRQCFPIMQKYVILRMVKKDTKHKKNRKIPNVNPTHSQEAEQISNWQSAIIDLIGVWWYLFILFALVRCTGWQCYECWFCANFWILSFFYCSKLDRYGWSVF